MVMLLVTHIDTYESLDEDIQFKIDNGLGLWTSKNDSELWEDVKNYIQPYTLRSVESVSYTHLTLPTNREV